MDPSQRRDGQQGSGESDGLPSPRDTRNPVTRGESSSGRDGVSFSDSLQQGETARRHPEGYGKGKDHC